MLATKSGIDGELKAKGELYLYPSFWEKVQEITSDIFIQRAVEALKPPPELEWYSIRDYDLSKARTNFRIDDFPESDGDVLLVLVRTGTASIKFDSPNADSYNLATYRKMRHSYKSVYLTNEAQADCSLRLLFGKGDWEVEQTTPTVDLEGLLQQENLAQITDPEKLADSIIRAAKIATHAVEAEKIAENAITETKIAPDSIATPHLKANIVTGDKIAAGTITGNLIAANVIAAYHLLAGIITAGKIATGAVTADKIATDSITADKYHELRNTIPFQDHDSLDATHPFEMLLEIISEMTAIQSVKLSFKIRKFRAYATGVPSGGGHTSSSGGGQTSSSTATPSGGGSTSGSKGTPSGGGATSGAKGTPSGGGHTTPSGGGHTSGGATHNHPGSTASGGTHSHTLYLTVTSTFDTGPLQYCHHEEAHKHGMERVNTIMQEGGYHNHGLNITDDGWHRHDVEDHQHWVNNHTHPDHTHTTPNHTHPGHTHSTPNHTHPGHTHTVSNHTHWVYSHTHSLSFGIYEEVQSPTINVYIDNGEGYGEDPIGTYTEDQLDIDITDHISGVGFKQVKFTSDKRTRIAALVMCKVDLTA